MFLLFKSVDLFGHWPDFVFVSNLGFTVTEAKSPQHLQSPACKVDDL